MGPNEWLYVRAFFITAMNYILDCSNFRRYNQISKIMKTIPKLVNSPKNKYLNNIKKIYNNNNYNYNHNYQ